MPRIFISYRREESIAYAGRVYDRLVSQFGAANVFIDIDTIEPGTDFVEVLQRMVASCDVFLAIIGREWTAAKDEEGRSRLSNPQDFVALEIGAALERPNCRVVPILVGGARMPRSTELPDRLAGLTTRQALVLPDMGFHQTLGRLIGSIELAERERLAREKAETAERIEVARLTREKAEKEGIGREMAEGQRQALHNAEAGQTTLAEGGPHQGLQDESLEQQGFLEKAETEGTVAETELDQAAKENAELSTSATATPEPELYAQKTAVERKSVQVIGASVDAHKANNKKDEPNRPYSVAPLVPSVLIPALITTAAWGLGEFVMFRFLPTSEPLWRGVYTRHLDVVGHVDGTFLWAARWTALFLLVAFALGTTLRMVRGTVDIRATALVTAVWTGSSIVVAALLPYSFGFHPWLRFLSNCSTGWSLRFLSKSVGAKYVAVYCVCAFPGSLASMYVSSVLIGGAEFSNLLPLYFALVGIVRASFESFAAFLLLWMADRLRGSPSASQALQNRHPREIT